MRNYENFKKEDFESRHCYRENRLRGKTYKYVWRRQKLNVLKGYKISCTVGKYKSLIDECMRREFKMNDKDLGLVYYLVSLDRVVNIDDFMNHGFFGRKRTSWTKMKSMVDSGLLRPFEGHNSIKCRKKSYECTTEMRYIYMKYVGYCTLTEKMSLNPDIMGEEWCTRVSDIENSRRTNYYKMVLDFNAEVEENVKHVNDEL